MPLGSAFSQILAAERKALNARVAAARLRAPGFDTVQFSNFLVEVVDPLVLSIAEKDSDAVRRCTVALFDMAIELTAKGMTSNTARVKAVKCVWADVAPHMIAMIIADPIESLGVLTNAAIQAAAIEGFRLDAWLTNMQALVPQAMDNRELRAIIAITAWCAGASHYRQSALASAATLRPGLACAAVGVDGEDWPSVASRYAMNSWWRPDVERSEIKTGYALGQFSGFGGRFGQPPRVRASAQGFFVLSGEQAYLLVADGYGATLHAAAPSEFNSAPLQLDRTNVAIAGDEVIAEDRKILIDWPGDGLELACNADSIAVTSPYSHSILLHPRMLP
jgi:hypothetical protein